MWRARDQFAALLPIRERASGPEDRDTLNTRHSLARWTGEAGMRPRPGTNPRRSCRPQAQVLGPEHRDLRRALVIPVRRRSMPGTRR